MIQWSSINYASLGAVRESPRRFDFCWHEVIKGQRPAAFTSPGGFHVPNPLRFSLSFDSGY